MDKCLPHTREITGSCMWCGKKLCNKCIAHQEGRKIYCENCFGQLNPIGKQKIPKQTTQQTQSKQSFDGHRKGETGEQPWI